MFKIYVGNLDYKVKIEQLRELFSVFAPIEDLVIPLDSKTKRAKGFAIVMIRDAELGRAAIRAMQGKRLLGRLLIVNEAVKRKKGDAPPVTKADLIRQGPFGPRMARFGDPRQRGSRNPRRGAGGRGEGSETESARDAGSRIAGEAARPTSAMRGPPSAEVGAVRPTPKPLTANPPKPSIPPRPAPLSSGLGSALDSGLGSGLGSGLSAPTPAAPLGAAGAVAPRPIARPKAQAKPPASASQGPNPLEAGPVEPPAAASAPKAKAKPKSKSPGASKDAKKKGAADQG